MSLLKAFETVLRFVSIGDKIRARRARRKNKKEMEKQCTKSEK